MKEFLQRLKAPTPKYFKDLLLWVIGVSTLVTGSVSGTLLSFGEIINHTTKEWLQIILGVFIFVPIFATIILRLPIDWDRVEADKISNVKIPDSVDLSKNEPENKFYNT